MGLGPRPHKVEEKSHPQNFKLLSSEQRKYIVWSNNWLNSTENEEKCVGSIRMLDVSIQNCGKMENQKEEGKSIKINPYDNLTISRKLIDKKNKQVGFFDLGNHILIAGMVLLVIFISLNVD